MAQRGRGFSQLCSSHSLNLVLIQLPRCDLPVETNGPDSLQEFKRNAVGNISLTHIPRFLNRRSGRTVFHSGGMSEPHHRCLPSTSHIVSVQ